MNKDLLSLQTVIRLATPENSDPTKKECFIKMRDVQRYVESAFRIHFPMTYEVNIAFKPGRFMGVKGFRNELILRTYGEELYGDYTGSGTFLESGQRDITMEFIDEETAKKFCEFAKQQKFYIDCFMDKI